MKKIILSLAMMLCAAGVMAQQTPEEKAAAKAAAAELKAQQKQAKSLLDEAVKLRDMALPLMQKADATAQELQQARQGARDGFQKVSQALESGHVDPKRLFEAWKCSDDLASMMLNEELQKAAASMPFDTLGFHNALIQVGKSKQGVLKYGNPKDDTQKLVLASAETQLVSIMTYYAYDGQFNMTSNPKLALQGFDTYMNYAKLFPEVANYDAVKNPKIPNNQIAYYAFMCAFEAKDVAAMDKYYPLAVTFEAGAEGVKQRKVMYYLQEGDTLRWAEECKKMAMADPKNNEDMIQNLLAFYQRQGTEAMTAFADEVLAADPENLIANYAKGYVLFSQEKYEDALALYQRCTEIKPEYVDAQIQCGLCLNNMGNAYNRKIQGKKFKSQAEVKAEEDKVKDFFRRAIPYFEKVEELCPTEPNRWAYELKTSYGVIGDKANEAKYKEICDNM